MKKLFFLLFVTTTTIAYQDLALIVSSKPFAKEPKDRGKGEWYQHTKELSADNNNNSPSIKPEFTAHSFSHFSKEHVSECYTDSKTHDSVQAVLPAVFVPEKLGKLNLVYDGSRFYIEKNKKEYPIKEYDIDPLLRGISTEKLEKFLDGGYIFVKQLDNEDYTLTAHVRGNGGLLLGATMCYYAVKILAYGVPAALAVMTVNDAIPAAPEEGIRAGITSLAKGAVDFATASGAAAAVGGGPVAAVSAGLAAPAIVATMGKENVTYATAAVASSGIYLVGGIEAAANAAFLAGMSLPF